MHKFVITASLIVLAAASACGGNSSSERPSSVLGPSDVAARPSGGGGGKGGGKGGGGTTGGGSGSLSLVLLADNNGNGLPNHGDTITFNITTTVEKPFVKVSCYQGSNWVYVASVGYFEAYPWDKKFILSATSWPSGAADCTATLYTSVDGSSETTLATLPFRAEQ